MRQSSQSDPKVTTCPQCHSGHPSYGYATEQVCNECGNWNALQFVRRLRQGTQPEALDALRTVSLDTLDRLISFAGSAVEDHCVVELVRET